MTLEENLEHQLKMTEELWKRFVEDGVTDGTVLVLDFMYDAPSKEAAEALSNSLSEYNTMPDSTGFFKKKWEVIGQTQPMEVSKSILILWERSMIIRGWEHQCEFDGFGTELP